MTNTVAARGARRTMSADMVVEEVSRLAARVNHDPYIATGHGLSG